MVNFSIIVSMIQYAGPEIQQKTTGVTVTKHQRCHTIAGRHDVQIWLFLLFRITVFFIHSIIRVCVLSITAYEAVATDIILTLNIPIGKINEWMKLVDHSVHTSASSASTCFIVYYNDQTIMSCESSQRSESLPHSDVFKMKLVSGFWSLVSKRCT